MNLREIYEEFHQQIHFLSIYIREAHPIDGWWLGKGPVGLALKLYRSGASTDIYDPKTLEERRAVAGECEESLQYGIRTYIDEMDDKVNRVYAAWPTRLYLIGIDGRVEYVSGPGPFGFKPGEFKNAIEAYLSEF